MKIVFFGTPDFAVASLKSLLEAGFDVCAVVTSVDKPAGRGLQIQESPVKKFAVEKGIEVLQPTNMKSEEFISQLKKYNHDLQVVIAFRMMPEVVWNLPPLGTMNLHASLLPQYRGAAPINHAIINGEYITGLTTFFLKHEIDTGNILLSEKTKIFDDETAGQLHDRLMLQGASLVVKSLKQIESGKYRSTEQIFSEKLKPAPKITKEFCHINFNQKTEQVYNFIRGLSPYPAAYFFYKKQQIKIFSCKKVIENHREVAGKIYTDGKKFLEIATINGYIDITELQLEGKKKMSVEEFLRGFHFKDENNMAE